jgi:murein DD-endopeptidase MepM/ murein hydrolase activator NlpD
MTLKEQTQQHPQRQNRQQCTFFQWGKTSMQTSSAPKGLKLSLMLSSVCCLSVAGLGMGNAAQAAVSEASLTIGQHTGLITEVSAGREADLATPGVEAVTPAATLVVLPNQTFLAATNTVNLPTSTVSTLTTLTPDSPVATTTLEAVSAPALVNATATPLSTSTPGVSTAVAGELNTEFAFVGSTMFEGSGSLNLDTLRLTSLVSDAALAQVTGDPTAIVVPSSSAPSPTAQIAQLTGVELQIIAPIARRVSVPRLPSLDLPPLASPDRFLPSESGTSTVRFITPAQGVFTSGYGPRWGRMHRGIDIAGPVGTPIVAAAAGVVVTSEWNSGGFGNLVEIRHADGTKTLYAHNSRLLVRSGQEVQQGEQIAEMGSTGRSTGPHLHFEIHPAGVGAINPMLLLNRG